MGFSEGFSEYFSCGFARKILFGIFEYFDKNKTIRLKN
jgi:hypothetical protein